MTDSENSHSGGAAPPRHDRRPRPDFIREIVEEDLRTGRHGGRVVTRFPPEPNGFLHIGHAKSLVLNFGIAEEYGGRCHLRFDDTNPETEDETYVRAIQEDVRWLGYDWGDHLYFAADYFERMYECAEILVRKGKAYVDSQSEEEIRRTRGSVTEAGRPGPYRDRPVEENLDLLRRMRAGDFADGVHVLRAKIDLAHPNMIMRDPVLYRIRQAHHYRTGGAWCIYPMYDYAHCLEDAFEDVTHSLCTLEFENNREIYDWVLDEVGFEEPRTHQYEFARLNLAYTVLSKRHLLSLVQAGHVAGWDDPRMPTLAGLRRRGVPPEAIRRFGRMIGVTKADNRVDAGTLEFAIRDHLNERAPRVMAVLQPLRVVIINYPLDEEEWLDAPYYPRDIDLEGSRLIPFGREIAIEREDFALDPPEGYRRMSPGREVRLRYGYVVRCERAVTDPQSGEVMEVLCTYDPATRGGSTSDGRRVPGTIHWVSTAHALRAEVRLYDRLFRIPVPESVPEGGTIADNLNPDSLTAVHDALVEPSVADDDTDIRYQFERTGYFWRDPRDSSNDRLVFNRIVTLRDSWSGRRAAGDRSGDEGTPEARDVGHVASARGPEDRVSDDRRVARASDPVLEERYRRYQHEFDLSLDDADVLTGSRAVSDLFEEALAAHHAPRAVASWVVNDVMRFVNESEEGDIGVSGAALGRLAALVDGGMVSRVAAKDVLAELAASGGTPEAIIERRGLSKLSDEEALVRFVDAVLEELPEKADAYRGGKTGLLGFFVGQVVRRSGGRADPKRTRQLLLERLGGGRRGVTRVRFAPSPTGFLHVGSARTALFNWLLARASAGVFVLRIEDTDRARSHEAHTQAILDGLSWLGLDVDEGPLFQGEGLERHRKDALRLLAEGRAYRDFLTPEDLRARAEERGMRDPSRLAREIAEAAPEHESAERASRGEPHALRFRVPEGRTVWDDSIHGEVAFANQDVDDLVLLRSDGTPTYNMAVVSDDAWMRITHVVRGDDHLSNTPKQILLYRALGLDVPVFGHVPLIVGSDGRRLAKRHGATRLDDYRHRGILPEAMLNFLALLGWSPGDDREVMSRDELVEAFSLARVLKESAVFDTEKLEWLNGRYLAEKPVTELVPLVRPHLRSLGVADDAVEDAGERLDRAVELLKLRTRTVVALARQAVPYLVDELDYDEVAIGKHWRKDTASTADRLERLRAVLEGAPWTEAALEEALRGLASELEIGAAKLIHPLRVALTGQSASPGIFEVLVLLGRARSLRRIGEAVSRVREATRS